MSDKRDWYKLSFSMYLTEEQAALWANSRFSQMLRLMLDDTFDPADHFQPMEPFYIDEMSLTRGIDSEDTPE